MEGRWTEKNNDGGKTTETDRIETDGKNDRMNRMIKTRRHEDGSKMPKENQKRCF